MSDVTIRSDVLTARISSLGAELQSVLDRDGTERLWQGDPAYWSGRAPVLFPVAGAFRGGGYELDGVWYDMPKHGFALREEWTVEYAGEDEAVFLLKTRHPGFPFDYELRARFLAEENRLFVDYTIKNNDAREFYCSVGGHEAYACPGEIGDYFLVFDEKENLDRQLLKDGLLLHETCRMAENTVTLPLTREMFTDDALVFCNLRSTGVTLACRRRPQRVHVEFDGASSVLFWRHPDAPYLCIEPWNSGPDFVDAPSDIARKPHIIRLKPGREANRAHTISFL